MSRELLVTPGYRLTSSPREKTPGERAVFVARIVDEIKERFNAENVPYDALFEVAGSLIENAMHHPQVCARQKINASTLIEDSLGENSVEEPDKLN